MDAQGGTVTALVLTSATINVLAEVQKKGPATLAPSIIANSALLITIVGIGQFISWDLAIALAALHFLATVLYNGVGVIHWVNKLTGAV